MERYRRENGVACIDVRFQDLKQLFDGRDPAPYKERDLDERLVKHLVNSCEEIPKSDPVKLVFADLEAGLSNAQKNDLKLAVHQYFAHESDVIRLDLKNLFKQGRMSLVLGLAFLTFCSFIAIKLVGHANVFLRSLEESLIVFGWVALWKPLNIFLYDWWPFVRKIRIYKQLSEIPIEFSLKEIDFTSTKLAGRVRLQMTGLTKLPFDERSP